MVETVNAISRHWLEGTKENYKKPLRSIGVPTDIRTGQFPNATQKRHLLAETDRKKNDTVTFGGMLIISITLIIS
jgi:hypothetical protein